MQCEVHNRSDNSTIQQKWNGSLNGMEWNGMEWNGMESGKNDGFFGRIEDDEDPESKTDYDR